MFEDRLRKIILSEDFPIEEAKNLSDEIEKEEEEKGYVTSEKEDHLREIMENKIIENLDN